MKQVSLRRSIAWRSLPAWLGLRVFKRLSDRQFELAVNLLLVVPGIGLAL